MHDKTVIPKYFYRMIKSITFIYMYKKKRKKLTKVNWFWISYCLLHNFHHKKCIGNIECDILKANIASYDDVS